MQTTPLTLRTAFAPIISQPFFIFVCQKVLVGQLSHSQSQACGGQSELVRPHFLTGCQRPRLLHWVRRKVSVPNITARVPSTVVIHVGASTAMLTHVTVLKL